MDEGYTASEVQTQEQRLIPSATENPKHWLMQYLTQQLQTGSEEQSGGRKVSREEKEKGMQLKGNYLQPLEKICSVSYKVQYSLTHNLAIILPDVHLDELKIHVHAKTCT